MASSINASTSGAGGLISTADSSGVLELQSGGTTVASIPNATTFNFPNAATRITGDFTNATIADRVLFQTSTTNGETNIGIIPNGTANLSGLSIYSTSDPTNASRLRINVNSDASGINISSGAVGAGTNLPLRFQIGSTTQMTIDTDGTITSTLGGIQVRSGTAVTASGTSVDFTGIPSWVKRITVMFSNLSTSGTSPVIIQLGTTSGFQTTGYTSAGATQAGTVTTATAGLAILTSVTAASNSFGNSTINLVGSNVWAQSGLFTLTGSIRMSGGGVTLSDTLTQVRITTVSGTDTFDAGSINILFE